VRQVEGVPRLGLAEEGATHPRVGGEDEVPLGLDEGPLTVDALVQLVGREGAGALDGAGPEALEDVPGLATEQSYLPPDTAEESPYLSQLRELSAALGEDGPCRVSVWDGVTAVALAEAARESISRGEPVDFMPWREQIAGAR